MGNGLYPDGNQDLDLSKFISPNEDINEDRRNAIELIKKYSKSLIISLKGDIEWFWGDLRIEYDKELEEDTKRIVLENYSILSSHYPFDVSEWVVNWYRFMPEIIEKHIDGTGKIDWNLFFSLVYPIKTCGAYSYQTLIHKLNIKQNQQVREEIYQECYEDSKLRKALINREVIPPIYTYYTPYNKIRKEVMKKAGLPSEEQLDRSLERKVFRIANRIKSNSNCTTDIAIKMAIESLEDKPP